VALFSYSTYFPAFSQQFGLLLGVKDTVGVKQERAKNRNKEKNKK